MTRMASPEQFKAQIKHVAMIYKTREDAKGELSIIGTALASDTTTHDATMQTPPSGLKLGGSQSSADQISNKLRALVNRGKGGNLTNAEMSTAIGEVIAALP